jgi:predicted O-methyltransferase YrrM
MFDDVRRPGAALLLLAWIAAAPSSVVADELYRKPYAFGEDWFSSWQPIWERHLAPLRGKPGLHYLEVGPYEGRAFFWMVDHVLTHPTSRATAIDVFVRGSSTHYDASYESTFRKNLALSGAEERVTVIKGRSQVELRPLPLDSFDVIYIDGSHDTPDVLADLVLSWALLKDGGLLILDDYRWGPEWPSDIRPALAINAFVSSFAREIRIVHRQYQMILTKRPDPCEPVHYEACSVLGPYLYDWREGGRLLTAADLREVPLARDEKDVIEEILRNKRLGQPEPTVPRALQGSARFRRLNEKLALGF